MSRKSLIFCFSALAAMVVMIVAAVAFLYREEDKQAPVASRYALAHAVPSNAVMVCFLSEAYSLSSPVFSSFEFSSALAEFLYSGKAKSLALSPLAISMHYSGSPSPMFVFDAGPASDIASEDAEALIEFAGQKGFYAEWVNCSEIGHDGPLASHSLVMIAKTRTQINISKSHMKEGRSIMDADGFDAIAKRAPENVAFVPYEHVKALLQNSIGRKYSSVASFFQSFAGWASFSLEDDRSFVGIQEFSDVSDYMSVLAHNAPAVSSVSAMLPSYTCFALTLPMRDAESYVQSYSAYLESAKRKVSNQTWQDGLKKKTGLSPKRFVERLGVTEVASATFPCGDRLETVNLVKINHADTLLLRGTGDKSFGGDSQTRPYAYAEYIASVFGKYFTLSDESCFTYKDGWLITGSSAAIDEYVDGLALEYNLKTYMADAGKDDLLADRVSSCVVYVNVPNGSAYMKDVLNKDLRTFHDALKGDAEYAPIVASVFNKNGKMHTDLNVYQLQLKRSRAPKFERDTKVTVPSGPFKVINSGTGRTNLFYQQSNGAICLKEEDGKGIWGVPFKHTLCGTAHNIDYYANGNKQILFGAGSGIYLIDRQGRFVQGFPTDLGKEILIGPDVYDFNGVNAYNVLVLHKDNTVEMYNLKGKKPDSWLGIAPDETIKSLPERLIVGGKTFWVVRTSRQTLIYSFYGGKPLNSFKGDKMFLPAAEVKVKNSTTVEAECYDGKTRTLKVK
jgi:hypothetical protein